MGDSIIHSSTDSNVTNVEGFLAPGFEWLHHPVDHWASSIAETAAEGETEGTGGRIVALTSNLLCFQAPAKKDFWSRTFYTPLLIKHDASAYLYPIPGNEEVTITTTFSLNPISQFDQAGIFIYIDDHHWVKCGIEFCDHQPRLSVVVCNHGFADWSTQVWNWTSAKLRIHRIRQSSSVVIEAAPPSNDPNNTSDDNKFQFIRIAHLSASMDTGFDASDSRTFPVWRVGPFAACPIAQRGCEASFAQFSIGPRLQTAHSSEL